MLIKMLNARSRRRRCRIFGYQRQANASQLYYDDDDGRAKTIKTKHFLKSSMSDSRETMYSKNNKK